MRLNLLSELIEVEDVNLYSVYGFIVFDGRNDIRRDAINKKIIKLLKKIIKLINLRFAIEFKTN